MSESHVPLQDCVNQVRNQSANMFANEDWVSHIKQLVNESENEDYGTFVAAWALLNDAYYQDDEDANSDSGQSYKTETNSFDFSKEASETPVDYDNIKIAGLDFCRIDAEGYCSAVSDDYEPWVSSIKNLVRDANETDFGIYISACALLYSAVPFPLRDQVERRIRYLEKYEAFSSNKKKEQKKLTKRCVIFSGFFSLLGSCIIACLFALDLFWIPRLDISIFSSIYSIFLFSIFGGLTSGFILSKCNLIKKSNRKVIISCFAGLISSIVCPAFPPIALILCWYALHISEFFQPMISKKYPQQVVYNRALGIRAFAEDPHSPDFVRRAIRLAGIYKNSSDYIGKLSQQALDEEQTDFGSYIAYEAYLLAHHSKFDRHSLYSHLLDGDNKENHDAVNNNSDDDSDDTNNSKIDSNNKWTSGTIKRDSLVLGIISSAIATLLFMAILAFSLYVFTKINTNIDSLISWLIIFTLSLIISCSCGASIGVRSGCVYCESNDARYRAVVLHGFLIGCIINFFIVAIILVILSFI